MLREATYPPAAVNVLDVSSESMAAFQVILYGRFWVFTEETLSRQMDELRTAVQLERRFSRRELFTIFTNRVTFGEDIVGVEPASQHFFHKQPNHLLIEEATLLAGLVKAPSYFSPIKHPDRALRRRNEVIDKMLETRSISESKASAAKASPLSIMK